MPMFLRPPHVDGLWGEIRQNIVKAIKRPQKNVRAVKNKEKRGVFKTALLRHPAGKFLDYSAQ